MTHTVLRIDASAASDTSVTRHATAALAAMQNAERIIIRDVANAPLPVITQDWANARLVPAEERSDTENQILAQSDALVTELMAADTLIIGLPIYNFGMPASLKAYIDLIARPKLTFTYTPDGPKGLLSGKSAIVAVASGGTAIGSQGDFASTHIVHVLNFLGITDVTVVDAKDYAAQDSLSA